MKTKTISGHFSHKYYINHNNRTGKALSSNIDAARSKNNYNKVTAGSKNCDGVYCATLEEVYNKVFESSWQEYQQKQRPVRRFSGTYLDYIRQKQSEEFKNKNGNSKSKTPHEAYEIIFQVGNIDDTGYKDNPDDYFKGCALMRKTIDYICNLPNTAVITEKELKDPDWKLPFDNGLIILNNVSNEDESSPHIHTTIIPVASSDRGSKLQNSLGKCFENMGYPTSYNYALDEDGNRIPKRDKNNQIVTDAKGNIIYKKDVVQKGVLDWVDDIKNHIAQEMQASYGWKRAEPSGNKRKHMSVQEYKNYANSLSDIKKEINKSYDDYQIFNDKFYKSISDNNYKLDYFQSADMSKLWREYKEESSQFWDWYKHEKTLMEALHSSIKSPEEQRRLELNYINQLLFKSNSLLEIVILLIAKLVIRLKEREAYDKQIKSVIKKQNELKQIAKDMSTKNAAVRNALKSNTCDEQLIAEMKMLRDKLTQEYDDYTNIKIKDAYEIFD